MKKYLFIIALWFASIIPNVVYATPLFAVCATTCTWDNSSTAMWSTSSGGATGSGPPTAADTVTINAATCVGGTTCTITTFAGTISVGSITWGACTASTTGCIIKADTNNTNFTILSTGGTPFSGSGTGTRKWLAGTGTYNLTSINANPQLDMGTTTNDQGSVFSGATWNFVSSATNVGETLISPGGFAYGPTSFTTGATGQAAMGILTGSATFAPLTLNAPLSFAIPNNITITITGALTVSGSSNSNPVLIRGSGASLPATLAISSASAVDWTSFRNITTSGAGTLTATNCINFKQNTFGGSSSCTAPSVGGGGGRIIGG